MTTPQGNGGVRRPLPRTVRPMADETINSYLFRLAAANHVTTRDLAAHLGTRLSTIATKVRLQALAAASGQPPAVLSLALPELAHAPTPAGQPATAGAPVARPACRRCAAARGIAGTVTVWTGPEHNICLRHRLWVGQAVTDPAEQLDLAEHPEVVRAQVRHHRLIRRFGPGEVHAAFRWAGELWVDVTWRGYRQPYRTNRELAPAAAAGERPWRLHTEDPAYQAATYPETVTLTALIADPPWRNLALSEASTDHDRFHAELWRRLPAGARPREPPRLINLHSVLRHATTGRQHRQPHRREQRR